MMNQIVLLGKVAGFPIKDEKDFVIAHFTMEVERPYRSADGNIITDIFPVVLWRGSADELSERHHIGDVVAVKGRLETDSSGITIIAERISFITESSKTEEKVH